MYEEDDLLPLSAIQHLAFCERQCALIHLEGLWADNLLTVLGQQLHERTREQTVRQRGGVLIERGLPLRSLTLGLVGKADVVEFHPCAEGTEEYTTGASLNGLRGRWSAFPVEYKRGRAKLDHTDEVQLCAQAICLEEMVDTRVPEGAMYYGQPRRRQPVTMSEDLREETRRLAGRLHELVALGTTPQARYEPKCRGCSLLDLCLPRSAGGGRSARRYLRDMMQRAQDETGEVGHEASAQ